MTTQVALVTGAAKGLGRAFSQALLQRGAKVCLSDINEELGAAATQALQSEYGKDRAMFIKCDTTSKTEMEDMFSQTMAKFGGIDLVVNNAGLMHEQKWEQMLLVNLHGVIRGTLLGMQHMRRDEGGRGGHIINIASSAGILAVPFSPGYSASKHGVVAYTRSWAENPLRKKMGIRFNCLCPFFTKTDILDIKPEQTASMQVAEAAIKMTGVMEVSDVVKAFERFLDEDSLNGAVMQVSRRGQKIIEFKRTGLEEFNEKAKL